jgi:tRNA pseudouridine38-40 synthase
MPTYRLDLEYDGTKFSGWQVQASGRTVQGVLLDTLREIVGQRDLDLQGAGRTDAGVHALGQVASLRIRRALEPRRLQAELDRALPADLAVLGVRAAHPRFHARHDAVARVYRYQITGRRSAFGKRTTWWVPESLDARRMAAAARAFEGRHDFRGFARRAGEAESTLGEVAACRIATLGEFTLIRVVGSHFLWNQVRRMVGALVTVGRGAARPDDVAGWLAGRAAPPAETAPAAGLFLEAVRYAGERAELPPLVPVGPPAPARRAAAVLA